MEDLRQVLRNLGFAPFEPHAMDALTSAREELDSRTPYVTPGALKFFAARIISARPTHDGLFYRVVESLKSGFEDYRRQYRVTYFDVFGEVVSDRDTYASKREAVKADRGPPDVAEHYREAIAHRMHTIERERANLEKVLEVLQ